MGLLAPNSVSFISPFISSPPPHSTSFTTTIPLLPYNYSFPSRLFRTFFPPHLFPLITFPLYFPLCHKHFPLFFLSLQLPLSPSLWSLLQNKSSFHPSPFIHSFPPTLLSFSFLLPSNSSPPISFFPVSLLLSVLPFPLFFHLVLSLLSLKSSSIFVFYLFLEMHP